MIAIKIKQLQTSELALDWDDNHKGAISLQTLRDQCPCAECRGETILLKTYSPVERPHLPGRYNIVGIKPVGNYAIQIYWEDKHGTGIYTWEYLRNLCECPECSGKMKKQENFLRGD
jgi:DUF971 family protein